MIFFNHVPKSGGTSLGASLQECFAHEEVFTGLTLQRLGWSDGRAGEYIRLAPRDLLDSFKFVGGHLGEPIRQELFSDRFCIALARDPRSRFVSLIRHLWRDAKVFDKGLTKFFRADKTIQIDDVDDFMRTYVKATTMFFFVDKPWKPSPDHHWQEDWDRAIRESIANIENYDLCITTENLVFYEAFIREAMGSPSAPVRERLNAAEQVGDTTGDAIKEELGEIWDKHFTQELEFYTAYKAKSDAQKAAIEEDRAKWLYWMRGRLAQKQTSWTVDWDAPVKGKGWSERALPGGDVYGGRRARLVTSNIATNDVLLEGGLTYQLRCVFWTSDFRNIKRLKIRIGDEAVPVKVERPHPFAREKAIALCTFKVPANASYTRLELDFIRKPEADVWCLDMSITPHFEVTS